MSSAYHKAKQNEKSIEIAKNQRKFDTYIYSICL